jgi:5'-3' exonuclease
MSNLILIDTSYITFYRFFAILRWLRISNLEEYKNKIDNPQYNWFEDKLFLEKYEKLYYSSIVKIVGKKNMANAEVIFCMDSPKETVWRTELHCDYKSDRIDLSKKNDFKPIFKYTYQNIIPNLLSSNPNIKKIKIDNLEADDVIAIITKYYEVNDPEKKIFLISGDSDFLQLGRENLFFINFKNKKYIQISKDEAKLSLHKKVILGDKSDCISTILPHKFSLSKKKEILNSIEYFNEWIDEAENDNIKQKYINNLKLIDFNYIPQNFQELIINTYLK